MPFLLGTVIGVLVLGVALSLWCARRKPPPGSRGERVCALLGAAGLAAGVLLWPSG